MLPNYDAKAIAEVMGLVFSPGAIDGSEPVHPTGTREHKASAPVPIGHLAGVGRGVETWTGENSPPSPAFIEKAVERGLPRSVLRHVAERIIGADTAKISALEWGIVPKTTLERRKSKLTPQESERTERVARLFVHARRALGTDAEAREFMTKPHPELDGRSPVDAAKTDLATRRTEQILNALEYGLAL